MVQYGSNLCVLHVVYFNFVDAFRSEVCACDEYAANRGYQFLLRLDRNEAKGVPGTKMINPMRSTIIKIRLFADLRSLVQDRFSDRLAKRADTLCSKPVRPVSFERYYN